MRAGYWTRNRKRKSLHRASNLHCQNARREKLLIGFDYDQCVCIDMIFENILDP